MIEINGGVSITLFAHPLLSEADITSENKRGEKRGEKLSENRQKILNAMRENPGVSQAELVEIVGIVSTNIEKNIKYLKDNGWIRRIVPNCALSSLTDWRGQASEASPGEDV